MEALKDPNNSTDIQDREQTGGGTIELQDDSQREHTENERQLKPRPMQNQTTVKPGRQIRKRKNEGLKESLFSRNKGNEQYNEQPSTRKHNREDG